MKMKTNPQGFFHPGLRPSPCDSTWLNTNCSTLRFVQFLLSNSKGVSKKKKGGGEKELVAINSGRHFFPQLKLEAIYFLKKEKLSNSKEHTVPNGQIYASWTAEHSQNGYMEKHIHFSSKQDCEQEVKKERKEINQLHSCMYVANKFTKLAFPVTSCFCSPWCRETVEKLPHLVSACAY